MPPPIRSHRSPAPSAGRSAREPRRAAARRVEAPRVPGRGGRLRSGPRRGRSAPRVGGRRRCRRVGHRDRGVPRGSAGGHRHAPAEPPHLRRVRPRREPAERGGGPHADVDGRRGAPDRGPVREPARRRPPGPAVGHGRDRRSRGGQLDPDLRVRSGTLRAREQDRYGLARQRPTGLAELPAFPGDELDPARSGGTWPCRRAPTIRSSPSMPCTTWLAWLVASPCCAGRRPASAGLRPLRAGRRPPGT